MATSPNRIDYLRKRAVLLSQLAIAVWPDDYIIFRSLALCIIENLSSRMKIAKVGTKFTKSQIKSVPKKFPRTVKMLQKWRNFAKSGHTAEANESAVRVYL